MQAGGYDILHQAIKIYELNNLATLLRQMRKKVVLCHGCFDLLHIGHIRYLRKAKEFGDILVVTVTPDKFVDKGVGRPAFNESLRVEALASLDCVDYVAINKWRTATGTLELLRPSVYVKGSDFKGGMDDKLTAEKAVCDELGIRLEITDDVVFSSTNLINRYLSNLPEDVREYIELFKQRHSVDEILGLIDRMKDINVAVVGDVITDQYTYGDIIGKATKDPALVMLQGTTDKFNGGASAVFNHVRGFAKAEIFPSGHEVVKRRFVDSGSFGKVFELHSYPTPIPVRFNCEMRQKDVVLMSDFGHGAVDDLFLNRLKKIDGFLGVNTQANCGNGHFNTIGKYVRADFVSLSENELRLEFRDKHTPLRTLMERLAASMGTRDIIITCGRKGCYVLGSDFVYVPALTSGVVDRIGAGDAVFAVTSLLSYLGADSEVVGFVGSVVGAMAVGIIGNEKSIGRDQLKAQIRSVLK